MRRFKVAPLVLTALLIAGCSNPTDGFTVGKEYPVHTRGYVCNNEADLVKAKDDLDSSGQFIKQLNCVRVSFGDKVKIMSLGDEYLTVQISVGMDRGVATTGFSGLTVPGYLNK